MHNNNQFLLSGAPVKILVGEFGSGKTELALNYALQIKEQGFKTVIVDIDLVKPYFRTRENRTLLEQNGIEVIAPEVRWENADLPILPHHLARVLGEKDCRVVMDVGGGESAVVLGQLNRLFASTPYQALLVVNTCRPFTNTVDAVVELHHRIENVSKLKITGIISNTNLAAETNEQHIYDGLTIAEAAAEQLAAPVLCVAVPEWLADKIDTRQPILVVKPHIQYPWMG
ncbi:MAG TPA: hypothetical protein VN611_01765 [Patescibacteria group bacterium]|nr:hypothetical protein [Patescibacteria group bacterium]